VLEVAGATRGPIHELTTPLVHIGRGANNAVVIDDASVSDAHAKLQLRNDGWYVVDLETTNGTYVNGMRVTGERKLSGSPVIRFGSVTAIFRPRDLVAEVRKGGHVIAGAERAQLHNTLATVAAAPGTPAAASRFPAVLPERTGIRAWVWISVILALVAAAAFFVLNP
jgi:pSer/pThr/pTyr-binding forkhead associated (FHA) protein